MKTQDNSLTKPTSLREKLAQLMVVRIGSNLPPIKKVEEDADRVEQLLSSCPLGGLILFNGQREKSSETLAKLQSRSKYPLLVSSDIERGVGQQLHGYPLFPHAMSFSALGDEAPTVVEEFAYLTAVLARQNGIHIAFAPVADVNVDPQNPIIATRAFGSDAERVAELVAAYVQGCQRGGLLATSKHFPGHGNTRGDSHHELPTVSAFREELEKCELVPFRAAIQAGVSLLMSAHVQYPAWDPSGRCATLSKPILTELLRKELGFEGVLTSDSLLMEGVKSQCANEGELAVEALNAGVDMLLDVATPEETLDAMEQAVASGKLSEQTVEVAFDRIWKLKEITFGSGAQQDIEELEQKTQDLVEQVAKRSITVLSQQESALPLNKDISLFAVLIQPFQIDEGQQPVGGYLQEHFSECTYYEVGPEYDKPQLLGLLAEASSYEQILIMMIVKPAAWHRFGLLPEQEDFIGKICSLGNCALVSLGVSEVLEKFDNPVAKICTFSDVPASQEALASILAGK